ncbi:hypothetical protein BKK56_10700 [Rodentibacter genomosp. 2]|nr:hypothetical protein BKK56_10700 [Rodentibacter genomosp. 2]
MPKGILFAVLHHNNSRRKENWQSSEIRARSYFYILVFFSSKNGLKNPIEETILILNQTEPKGS